MPHCPNCGEDLSGWPITETEFQARSQEEADLELELSQLMTFGKYRNWRLELVLRTHPQYIVWAAENVDHFNVSPALLAEARNKASLGKVQPPQNDPENRYASEEDALLLSHGVSRNDVLLPKD